MAGYYTTTTDDGMRWTVSEDFKGSFPVALPSSTADAESDPACNVLRNKSGRSTIIIKNVWNGKKDILVKSFWVRTWLEYLKYLFVPTRAYSEWDNNLTFQSNNIPTVKPLAIGETRQFGVWKKNVLILEAISSCTTLHKYLEDSPDSAETSALLEALAEKTALIHNCDIYYRDLHGEHIIVKPVDNGTPSFFFVDLHEVKMTGSITKEMCVDDLGRLNGYIHTSPANRLKFLRKYLQTRRVPDSEWKSWARDIDIRSHELWDRFYEKRGSRIDAYGLHAPKDGEIKEDRSLLILDKVFLSPHLKALRGVEVFNVNFMKDLVSAGFSLTVPIHETWSDTLHSEFGDNVETVESSSGGALTGGVALAFSLRKRKFSALLLTNVANRLLPMMKIFRFFKCAPYCTLIAHREPTKRNLHAQKAWPSRIVAVNEKIADHFRKAGFPSVTVYYGITKAERFHPPTEKAEKETVDFCILGHLDSAWKGSDTAVAAFKLLGDDMKKKCRLHLASFRNPPVFDDENIVLYDWMPFNEVSDLLRKMDVMLVPSRDEEVMRETFSQAIVQGMLTGLPCIVNNLPILNEKLDNGGGLIFNTVEKLRDHITDLANSPEKREKLGKEAREIALSRYVWDSGHFMSEFLAPPPRH